MRAHRTGGREQARRLRSRAVTVCFATGFILIAMGAGLECGRGWRNRRRRRARQRRRSRARRSRAAETKPGEAKAAESKAGTAEARGGPADEQKAKAAPEEVEAAPKRRRLRPPTPPRSRLPRTARDLLKMANSLKVEVDKTTQDTLSLAVIRQAEEIEKLAHKMRTR